MVNALRSGWKMPAAYSRQFYSPSELREQASRQRQLASQARSAALYEKAKSHTRQADLLDEAAASLSASKVL